MQTGVIIIVKDLIGFYVGTENGLVCIDDGKGKVHKVKVNDDLKNHEVINPHALAKLYYDKLVAQVQNNRANNSGGVQNS